MRDELQAVETALRDGYTELARNLLRVQIEDYPDDADVWYLAAHAAVNDAQRKAFLQKAVDIDPLHHRAANALHTVAEGGTITFSEQTQSQRTPQPATSSAAQPQSKILQFPQSDGQPASQPAVRYAKFWRRAVSAVIDIFISVVIPYIVVAFIVALIMPDLMPNMSQQTMSLDIRLTALAVAFIVPTQIIYYGYFLSQNNGQTVGKAVMKIRVVKRDETPITVWDAFLRNVVGYVIAAQSTGLSFFWGFLDPDRRTWHDHIAGTIVIDA